MNTTDQSFITIVSGLPRSGTSMMMQMLSAGGMELLTDQLRAADEDNLKGYYEYEPVKASKRDNSWVKQAVGKAVKVIYAFLTDLPAEYQYRVVFMRRSLSEALRSQQNMLARRGEKGATADSEQLQSIFARQLANTENWLRQQPNFQHFDVQYKDVLDDPETTATQVAEFLQASLDIQAMGNIVDSSLYRQREPQIPQ